MSAVHLHLLLNHVPVIGTAIGLCLLAYAAVRKDEKLARTGLVMFVLLAVAAVATFLTGEPAEERLEGVAGVSEALVERHEEAALLATIALGALGVLSLAALVFFRRRALPRLAAALFVLAAAVPAGALAFTANLGGQIRHPEIRAAGAAQLPAGQAGTAERGRSDADD